MFFKEFHAVSDSIFNVEREESINHLRIQYEAERQENMLRKQEIDFVKQRRRLHVTLLILLLLMVISVSIYILYRRKDRLYRQIVIQQHEFLQKEKRMAAQIQPPSPETEKNGHDEDLFGKIEYLMQTEHLYRQNGFSIENLAEKIGINRTYLSRAINRSAGKSFSSYINDYRINEAVRRLSDINEDIPLKALATSLGYNHIQTFYTSFQNSIGMPPAQYRKRLVKLRKEQHF